MRRRKKDMFLFDADECYAEAQRRIGECLEKKGRKLDFSHLHLHAIPPEITKIKTLTELDITGIRQIPGFIGDIASLQRLSVGSRHSSGHECESVILPDTLGNLRNLRNLFLGYDIPEIPQWVWALKNLQSLSICNDTIETISPDIGELKNLRKLRIHGDKIAELPTVIGERLSLHVIDLSCEGIGALPESFENLKKMRAFLFNRCNLKKLPDYICGWTDLEIFEISMANTFQGPYTKLRSLPRNMGNLKKLNRLVIDGAYITPIPESLGDCPLEYCKINGDFTGLPETFGKLSRLEHLTLDSSRLTTLPDSFGDLSALRECTLYSGASLTLPDSVGRLSALRELSIKSWKNITLPESLGALTALEDLYIESDSILSLPESLGGCANLKLLMVEGEKISAIPRSLGKLKKLEELHLDTFALSDLPDVFSGLSALKCLDIFSGVLTAFPESIGTLKKLESLCLDAYKVKTLPDSFKNLSYMKNNVSVHIGGGEQAIPAPQQSGGKERGAATASIDELRKMSYSYRWKLFESYSLKQLDALLCSLPSLHSSTDDDKEIFKNIMLARRRRLNWKFKWTPENIQRIVAVSDQFLRAWEEGFARAKMMLDTLYAQDPDKDAFREAYSVRLIVEPIIEFGDDEDSAETRVYDAITRHLDPDIDLCMYLNYDPAIKDEKGFREDINICRDLSWNIEGFGDLDLRDHYICYALHVLYSHNEWANEDIMKINAVSVEVELRYRQ
jgi:Leucine-rich repeat (LRR) protein